MRVTIGQTVEIEASWRTLIGRDNLYIKAPLLGIVYVDTVYGESCWMSLREADRQQAELDAKWRARREAEEAAPKAA